MIMGSASNKGMVILGTKWVNGNPGNGVRLWKLVVVTNGSSEEGMDGS